MKQLSSYVRAVGYLNKLFDLLNEEFFESELLRPTITIMSTPKAYGHFTLNPDTWKSITGDSYEINIGAGTLNRPIELTATTMYHEMTHLFCHTRGIKDTSNGFVYHNHRFKDVAESHGGVIVEKDPLGRYGWTITKPSDRMLDFILKNSLTDILIGRNEGYSSAIVGGTGAHNGTTGIIFPRKKSSSHKLTCSCGNIIRATKPGLRIKCLECDTEFVYED